MLTRKGIDAIINVSKSANSPGGNVLFHEQFHVACRMFLTQKQYDTLMNWYDQNRGNSQAEPEELAGDGFRSWRRAREKRRGTLWGKLYQKIWDGCVRIGALFGNKKAKVHEVFRKIESGEIARQSGGVGNGTYNENVFDKWREYGERFKHIVEGVNGNPKKRAKLEIVCETPPILQQFMPADAAKLPIAVRLGFVENTLKNEQSGKKHSHGITTDVIKEIPFALSKPLAVLKSATVDNSIVVFTELHDKENRSIVVPIEIACENVEGTTNLIKSIYGRNNENAFLKNQLEAGNVLYVNTKKAPALEQAVGLQLPQLLLTNSALIEDSIAQDNSDVNIAFAGYDGYSMSNNAREAYANGERPISKWGKADILDEVKKIAPDKLLLLQKLPLNRLRKATLYNSSWHHTSKMYNKTEFYAIDADKIAKLSVDGIRELQQDIPTISYVVKRFSLLNGKKAKEYENVKITENAKGDIVVTDDANRIIYRGNRYARNVFISEGSIDKIKEIMDLRASLRKTSNPDVSFSGISEPTSAEKFASAVVSPATRGWRGAYQKGGVKGLVTHIKEELYTDIVDKYDRLGVFDKGVTSDNAPKVLDMAHQATSLSNGATSTLLEGDALRIKALEEITGMKFHDVSLKQVLEQIKPEEMSKKYPDLLAKANCPDWYTFFSWYLASERLLEMSRLRDEAFLKEHAAWRKKVKEFEYWKANDGAKETMPEPAGAEPKFEPYKMPQEINEDDCLNFIDLSPDEFKRAANLFYLWNDNLLQYQEYGGLISGELHNLLNTKYKHYCALMRDFSDSAGFDAFIGGLTNGGKGFANVKNTIRKISIEGSDKKIISPLETAVKAATVICNRVERNRVAKLIVERAQTTDIERGLGLDAIQEAPGETRADPKRGIFTVMDNGKVTAYKCLVPELYQPIVGYDEQLASIFMDFFRMSRDVLRETATGNWSFTIRNLIRDTQDAYVRSRNGFIPVYSSIRGLYRYLYDPEFRAKFDAAGIVGGTYYNTTKLNKTLAEIGGENKMSAGNFLKFFVKNFFWPKDIAQYSEIATRAGEFDLALRNGKDITKAALEAINLINFGRSGVLAKKANTYVPFLNSSIQGIDLGTRSILKSIDGIYELGRVTAGKQRRYSKEEMRYRLGMGARIASLALLAGLMWYLNGDDDDYEELDPAVKYNSWYYNGVYVPMSQEYSIINGLVIAALEKDYKGDRKAYNSWAAHAKQMLTPSLSVPILTNLVEGATNYSFYRDKPLEPAYMQSVAPENRAFAWTSETAKAIGKLTGMSPIKIDNFVRGQFASLGTALTTGVVDPLIRGVKGIQKENEYSRPIQEREVVRDFAVNDNKLSKSIDEVYALHTYLTQHSDIPRNKAALKGLVGTERYPGLYKQMRREMKDARNIRDGVLFPNISNDRKQQLIAQHNARARELAQKAIKIYGKNVDY